MTTHHTKQWAKREGADDGGNQTQTHQKTQGRKENKSNSNKSRRRQTEEERHKDEPEKGAKPATGNPELMHPANLRSDAQGTEAHHNQTTQQKEATGRQNNNKKKATTTKHKTTTSQKQQIKRPNEKYISSVYRV